MAISFSYYSLILNYLFTFMELVQHVSVVFIQLGRRPVLLGLEHGMFLWFLLLIVYRCLLILVYHNVSHYAGHNSPRRLQFQRNHSHCSSWTQSGMSFPRARYECNRLLLLFVFDVLISLGNCTLDSHLAVGHSPRRSQFDRDPIRSNLGMCNLPFQSTD